MQTFSPHKSGENKTSGVVKYSHLRKTICNSIKALSKSPDCWFTTLIDYYGLPDDFPGKHLNILNKQNPYPSIEALEYEFDKDISCNRFIPHVQLYEFESILFSDPDAFSVHFDNPEKIQSLKNVVIEFGSVERINDGPNSAPSKRISHLFERYKKVADGVAIAASIGLSKIREKCPHFDRWINKLETALGMK